MLALCTVQKSALRGQNTKALKSRSGGIRPQQVGAAVSAVNRQAHRLAGPNEKYAKMSSTEQVRREKGRKSPLSKYEEERTEQLAELLRFGDGKL